MLISMWHYIFDTEQEAEAYNEQVCKVKNYRNNKTSRWANPIKHPTLDKWAIAASGKVVLEDIEPQELTEDWTPVIED